MAFRHWKKGERGQAMVEFALVLPVLVLFLCGIIDFGWIFYNQIAINNGCREGARYAVIHYYQEDWATLQSKTDTYVNQSIVGVTPDSIGLALGGAGSDSLTVTVDKDVTVLTGVTSLLIGNDVNLTASSTMRIES